MGIGYWVKCKPIIGIKEYVCILTYLCLGYDSLEKAGYRSIHRDYVSRLPTTPILFLLYRSQKICRRDISKHSHKHTYIYKHTHTHLFTMDGRTTYSKIKDIFKDKEGVVTIHEIRKLLIMNVGSDERTITSCLRVMAEVGMIKDVGEYRFEIIK